MWIVGLVDQLHSLSELTDRAAYLPSGLRQTKPPHFHISVLPTSIWHLSEEALFFQVSFFPLIPRDLLSGWLQWSASLVSLIGTLGKRGILKGQACHWRAALRQVSTWDTPVSIDNSMLLNPAGPWSDRNCFVKVYYDWVSLLWRSSEIYPRLQNFMRTTFLMIHLFF